MPTYLFRCDSEHNTELRRPRAGDAVPTEVECLRCGREARRVWTPTPHIPTEGMYAHDARSDR